MKTEHALALMFVTVLVFIVFGFLSYRGFVFERETRIGRAFSFELPEKTVRFGMGEPMDLVNFSENFKKLAGKEMASDTLVLQRAAGIRISCLEGEIQYKLGTVSGKLKEGEEIIIQLSHGETNIALVNIAETQAEVRISFS